MSAICPVCLEPGLPGERFCEECGQPLGATLCAVCGAGAVDADGYCGRCGVRQPTGRDHVEIAFAAGPVRVAGVSDRGLRHSRNEDAMALISTGGAAGPGPDPAGAARSTDPAGAARGTAGRPAGPPVAGADGWAVSGMGTGMGSGAQPGAGPGMGSGVGPGAGMAGGGAPGGGWAPAGAGGEAGGWAPSGMAPGAAPGPAPGMAPGPAPAPAPGPALGAAPGSALGVAPGTAPGMTSGPVPTPAPGTAPGMAPGAMPGAGSGTAPGAAPSPAPGMASGPAAGTAPGMASGGAPGSVPGSVPGSMPGTTSTTVPATGGGPEAIIGVVCDGVSTSPRPDEASQTAADTAAAVIAERLAAGDDPVRATGQAVAAAAGAVAALAASPYDAPACTLVSAVVTAEHVTVGWVGDSRAYWLAGPGSTQLTHDDAAPGHMLTAWLGADAGEVVPHVQIFAPEGPGVVLVCSDGLWNYYPEPAALAEAVPDAAADPLAAARTLVNLALQAGGRDNITVLVIPFAGRR